MKKTWLNELARDLIALGSIPFLLLTIARVSVMQAYYPMQFIISSVIFFILRFIFKASLHAGLGLILSAFISVFYHNILFTSFAAIIYTGMIISLFYLGKSKKEIINGISLGAISAGIGYYIVKLIFF